MHQSLSLEKITISYSGRPIIKDFSWLFIDQGVTIILGRSGCGKSTLIKAIAGLVEYRGQIVNQAHEQSLVFQEPRLIPWLTVKENVLQFAKLKKQIIPESQLDRLLNDVGLLEFKELFPHQLSGGMKMRVSLARALVIRTKLLILDEPFSALDEPTRVQLGQLLLKLKYQFGVTIIMVSHQIEESLSLADDILLIEQGCLKKHYPLTGVPKDKPFYENQILMQIAQQLRHDYIEAK